MNPTYAATSERMSAVDTAWLRMDGEHNLMMIVSVWLLRPALGVTALRRRLALKLLRYERFRQKVVEHAMGASWVDDDDFDIARHVVPETLPRKRGRTDRQALQERVSELAATPLDHAHPLWQMHLIEHCEDGSAVVVRIHHCIADGVALSAVLMSIADRGMDLHPAGAAPESDGHDADWLAETVLKPLTRVTVSAIEACGDGIARALGYVAHPQQPVADASTLVQAGVRVLQDAATLATLPDDSPTALKGPLEGHKVAAWCEPLPLDRVKAVAKALACSVNDVLLSCVAGAVGHYLREQGEDPTGKEIRAMVPVNLRDPRDAWQLGNRFGLGSLMLPIGIENPVQRVYAVHNHMAQVKGSYQPVLAYALLAATGSLTRPLQQAVSDVFLNKTTAVMTNVVGPPKPIKLCGSTARQVIVWSPTSGEVGLGVTIVSYSGGVQFGLMADTRRCAHPEQIIDRSAAEFETLLLLTLMLPWAEEAGTHAGTTGWTPPIVREARA